MHTFLIILIVLIGLTGLFTLGLVIAPRPFRPHPAPTQPGEPRPFQPGLPDPVEKHFHETLGAQPQQTVTAVVWGRGRAQIRGVWVPLRFKAWYRDGDAFTRRFEITWFQRPVLRGRDAYLQGEGTYEMGDRVDSGPQTDLGQMLELWAGMLWMPTVFVHDPRVVWEPVDEHSARLVVPFGQGNEPLIAHFDPFTGRMTDFTAMRYAEESAPEKEPWRVDLLAWKMMNGILIPWQVDIAWGESGAPWVYWNVDGIVYNVNVSDQLGGEKK